MKSIDVNKTPLGMSRQSIGYYTVGLFAIGAGISSQQWQKYLLIGAGVILLVYGIMLLIEPLKKGLVDKIPDIVRMCLVILALSICWGQLMKVGVTQGTAFLTLALIYFAVFVCVNIAVSIKSVLRDSRLLVTIVISLAIVGFIQYLSDRSLSWHRFDLFFILIVWLVFLGFFLKNMLSTKKNQAKSNTDQNAG
jgi:hypothetical protein